MLSLLFAVWVAATPNARANGSVLVLPCKAEGGVDAKHASLFTFALAREAGQNAGMRAIMLSEIEASLEQETLRQVAGCDQEGCAAEIAGALNADELLFCRLTQTDGIVVATVSRVRTRDSSVLSRSMRRIPSQSGDLEKSAPAVVDELYADPGASGRRPALTALLMRGGAIGLVAAAGLALLSSGLLLGANALVVLWDASLQGQPGARRIPAAAGVGANLALGVGAAAGALTAPLLLSAAIAFGASWVA